jgi:CubicO group peptidase (beta-lactamase class C family)
MKKVPVIALSLLVLFIFQKGCEKFFEDSEFPASEFISEGDYQGTYWPTLAWKECDPREVGMDRKKLRELNDEILLLIENQVDMHSLLIIKDGYIVAEQYYSEEYGPDSLHRIYSCTKSFTSALFGITMDQEYDLNLSDKMIDFFPDVEIENLTEDKKKITVGHLLTMTDGLEWYELEYLYSDERNTFRQWVDNGAVAEFVLNRPTIASPGDVYSYNTGVSQVLSAILQRVTGTRTDSFALENLFSPLGIVDFYWPANDKDETYGGTAMQLTPRDMARFGYLYLQQGEWEGEQIVPKEWIEASQQPHVQRKYIEGSYYGYHWWVSGEGPYSAVGFGGQWITIIPEHDLVVVFANNLEDGDLEQWNTPERLLNTYILPAIQ